jgi:hypothetical protein
MAQVRLQPSLQCLESLELLPALRRWKPRRLQHPHNGRREPFLSYAELGGRCGLLKAEDSAVMDKQTTLQSRLGFNVRRA